MLLDIWKLVWSTFCWQNKLKLRKIKITKVERHQLGEGWPILFMVPNFHLHSKSQVAQISNLMSHSQGLQLCIFLMRSMSEGLSWVLKVPRGQVDGFLMGKCCRWNAHFAKMVHRADLLGAVSIVLGDLTFWWWCNFFK